MLGIKGKAVLLSLALLLAAGCAAKPSETVDMSTRLADSGIAEKKTTYQTVTVEKQNMYRTLNITGDVTYRLVRPVRTGSSQLVLKEILVSRNQGEKEGDPVAVLQGIGSASDIRQKELELTALQANMEERLAWYEEQIESIRDQAAYTKVRREIREEMDLFDPDSGELILGDIMISSERARTQAEEYGHSLKREIAFLTAHSMLHLMGYDHMDDQERIQMEKRQEEILANLDIRRD